MVIDMWYYDIQTKTGHFCTECGREHFNEGDLCTRCQEEQEAEDEEL